MAKKYTFPSSIYSNEAPKLSPASKNRLVAGTNQASGVWSTFPALSMTGPTTMMVASRASETKYAPPVEIVTATISVAWLANRDVSSSQPPKLFTEHGGHELLVAALHPVREEMASITNIFAPM